ncbi:MAG: SDR family oxidoreductase [Ignavibacteriales bacterium]
MPALRVLVTGGGGLLGQYLNLASADRFNLLTLYHEHVGNCADFNSAHADITDEKALELIFQGFHPEVVIHTAAISTPDAVKSLESEYVHRVNVQATRSIAALCARYGAKLIYTSTDLVYDGSKGQMLKENAAVNPVSLYASTKLLGEEAVKEVMENYIILRTSLLYGFGLNHATNHFHRMYLSLKEGKSVRLFHDQYRTPLALTEAARIIAILADMPASGETINFGGRERLSRYEMGQILCSECGFSTGLLERTSMYEVENLPKVADVSMDTLRLRSLGIEQKTMCEAIHEMISRK